jgi:hypothetical protein
MPSLANRLGFALVASLAILATAAAVALAETEKFHTEQTEGNTSITGEQAESTVFTGDFGTITCSKAEPESNDLREPNFTREEITLKVMYKNCLNKNGMLVSFSPNGCSYTLTKPSNVVHTAGPPAVIHSKSAMHIVCPTGEPMEFETSGTPCVITIPAQTPTTAATFDLTSEGTGTKRDIRATPTMEGLHYTIDGGALCGPGGTTTNGVIKGALTLKGYDTITGTQVGIWAT